MAYSEGLAFRIEEALVDVRDVEQKKMFRGLAFMVGQHRVDRVGTPGANMATPSGTFLSKLFEGPYSRMRKATGGAAR